MRIAITGGIGSGKSYVCQRLKERGIGVYDCDAGAKKLMASSDEIRDRLVRLIGEDAYDGRILNKAVVAKFLLESEENKLAASCSVSWCPKPSDFPPRSASPSLWLPS